MPLFQKESKNHPWWLKVIVLSLLFGLLAWIVWWYFNYRIESLKTLHK